MESGAFLYRSAYAILLVNENVDPTEGRTINRRAENRKNGSRPVSRIRTVQFARLALRSVLLLAAVVLYLTKHLFLPDRLHLGLPLFLLLIWGAFMVEMVSELFPSSYETMGCQKQFARNHTPVPDAAVPDSAVRQQNRRALLVAGAWILLNAVIGLLFRLHVLDAGILLLISLFYAVCDRICVLFFCPFQVWIMKNRCCVHCRIYRWDYVMMFTPLLFVPGPYSWSLLGLALILFLRWEWVYRRHPERFFEATNRRLTCAACSEQQCRQKESVRRVFLDGDTSAAFADSDEPSTGIR